MTSLYEDISGDVTDLESVEVTGTESRSVHRALERLERLYSELKDDYQLLREEFHHVKEKQRATSRHWKQVLTGFAMTL